MLHNRPLITGESFGKWDDESGVYHNDGAFSGYLKVSSSLDLRVDTDITILCCFLGDMVFYQMVSI